MFVIGAKRKHRYVFDESAGGLAITIREFNPEERDDFDKKWLKLVNAPGSDTPAGRETFIRRQRALLKDTFRKLADSWENCGTSPDKELPFTPENLEQFLADPETRKFWDPAIRQYLWPAAKPAEQEPDEEVTPSFR